MSRKKKQAFSVLPGNRHNKSPRGLTFARPKTQHKKTQHDTIDRIGSLKDKSELGTGEQEKLLRLADSFSISGELIATLVSSSGVLLPIMREHGSNSDIFVRPLPGMQKAAADKLKAITLQLSNINLPGDEPKARRLFETLRGEVVESRLGEGSCTYAFIRSYTPHTLRDAFYSNFSIPLPEMLKVLVVTLHEIMEAHRQGIVHGHIFPGNICFRSPANGRLLDYGVLISQARNGGSKPAIGMSENQLICPDVFENNVSKATDVWGFGKTLSAVLSSIPIQKEADGKDQNQAQAQMQEGMRMVFAPLISAATTPDPRDRIDLSTFRAMYKDLMPILFEDLNEVSKHELEQEQTKGQTSERIKKQIDEVEGLSFQEKSSKSVELLPQELSEEVAEEQSGTSAPSGDVAKGVSEEVPGESARQKSERSSSDDILRQLDDRLNSNVNEVEDDSSGGADVGVDNFEENLFVDDHDAYAKRFEASNDQIDFSKFQDETEARTSGFFAIFGSRIFTIIFACVAIYLLYHSIDGQRLFGGETSGQAKDPFVGEVLGVEGLKSAWDSGVSSQMSLVAAQAVYDNVGRILAERVVLGSVLRGEVHTSLVDSGAIRVAFSPDWEPDLNEQDRRYALALALSPLLGDHNPRDLGLLQDKHPGVILAVMSSASNNTMNFLRKVSSQVLESLPDRYGAAFQLLNTASEGKTCADVDILSLAAFATKGVDNSVLVRDFLSEDFKRRLSSLAVLYSGQPENALKVLDYLVGNPNFILERPEIAWAKKVELMQWNEIEATEKLFYIAGIPSRQSVNLSPQEVAKLFLNPSPQIRGYAAGLAIEKISFKHPAALDVLSMVHEDPEILSENQLIMLGQILEDPQRTAKNHVKVVKSFIASNPPLELSKHLLLATSTKETATILDSALAVYVHDKGWNPSASELEKLSFHPDAVARAFAYNNLLNNSDVGFAIKLLERRVKVESDKTLRKQVNDIMSTLVAKNK